MHFHFFESKWEAFPSLDPSFAGFRMAKQYLSIA